ncbi:MAG: class I SAM-dependent methyltransferase [Candidatus Izemoplasma sp.]
MIYNLLSNYYDSLIDQSLYDKYYKLIRKYKKSGTVIDLGAGTAVLSTRLAKKGYTVTATDISKEMLEVAYNNAVTSKVHINFYLHDILEPLNNFYDVVVLSMDVVNYLKTEDEVIQAFKNIENAMNKKSIFIFDTLNIRYVKHLIGYHEVISTDEGDIEWDVSQTKIKNSLTHNLKLNGESETHYLRTFSYDTYKSFLKKSNLKIVTSVKLKERTIYVCKKNH